MVDYLNAFDESYIPLNVQKGIEIQSEEMFIFFEDSYQQLEFRKTLEHVVQSLLKEDYLLIREAAFYVREDILYLYPFILDKIAGELKIFIQERIDTKQGKANYPFLPQDKIKVYKDGIVILTEMIALQRYFTKKYPSFDMPFKKDEAKQLIDSMYQKYFEVIKANSTGNESKNLTAPQNNNNVVFCDNHAGNEKLLCKDHEGQQKHSDEVNNVKIENNENIQPCCNACNIF